LRFDFCFLCFCPGKPSSVCVYLGLSRHTCFRPVSDRSAKRSETLQTHLHRPRPPLHRPLHRPHLLLHPPKHFVSFVAIIDLWYTSSGSLALFLDLRSAQCLEKHNNMNLYALCFSSAAHASPHHPLLPPRPPLQAPQWQTDWAWALARVKTTLCRAEYREERNEQALQVSSKSARLL
jgi:hypothetical protein